MEKPISEFQNPDSPPTDPPPTASAPNLPTHRILDPAGDLQAVVKPDGPDHVHLTLGSHTHRLSKPVARKIVEVLSKHI